jgi:DNA-binding MarR family transcriptional regulator
MEVIDSILSIWHVWAQGDCRMDAWTKFAESIFRINGLLIQAGESITGPIGQSSARWQVLGGLGYGPKTVSEIARDVAHARQSVQRVADVLAAEGLVAFSDKPGDRRTQLMSLTPAGRQVLGQIYARQVEWSARVVGQLSDDQLLSLATALQAIAEIVAANGAPQEATAPAATKTGRPRRQ